MFNLKKRLSKGKKGPEVNRSPHKVPPKCGVYPTHGDSDEGFPCQKCNVKIDVKHIAVTYTIDTVFTALYQQFDIFFPISECGNVTEYAMTVNGIKMTGELVREKNGLYLGPADPGFDSEDENDRSQMKTPPLRGAGAGAAAAAALPPKAESATQAAPKKEKTAPSLFYYWVKGAGRQLSSHFDVKRGTRLEVQSVIKTEGYLKESICNIPFPLATCPRSPDEFKYKFEMNENIRRIWSPNKSHGIFPYVTGKTADLSLDITKENRMRLQDYIFVVQIELGEPIVPRCADPVTIFILITAVAVMVFLTATRDLEDW